MKHGYAYEVVRQIYAHSPGRSWQRLNHALYETLQAAITAHLSFNRGDFQAMHSDMCGGYWMGNSTGSVCGEAFYSHAVKVDHTPACISFERFAGRPAALWSEEVKTPQRLCIGSEFTWRGLTVAVTNMRSDHLVACSYKHSFESREPMKVGSLVYLDEYRPVLYLKGRSDGGLKIDFGPIVENPSRTPQRIFKITYDELSAQRKAYDSARTRALKEIEASQSDGDLVQIITTLTAQKGNFRPFDIEEIANAISCKRKALKGSAA